MTKRHTLHNTGLSKIHSSGLNRLQRRQRSCIKTVDYVTYDGIVVPISPTKGFRKCSPWTILAIKKAKEN